MTMTFKAFLQLCESERQKLAPASPEVTAVPLPRMRFKHDQVFIVITARDLGEWEKFARDLDDKFTSVLFLDLARLPFTSIMFYLFGAAGLVLDYEYISKDTQHLIAANLLAQMTSVISINCIVVGNVPKTNDNSFLLHYADAFIDPEDILKSNVETPQRDRDREQFVIPFMVTSGEVQFEPVVRDWIGRADRVQALANKLVALRDAHRIEFYDGKRHHATYCESSNPRVVKIKCGEDILWEEFDEPNAPA